MAMGEGGGVDTPCCDLHGRKTNARFIRGISAVNGDIYIYIHIYIYIYIYMVMIIGGGGKWWSRWIVSFMGM
jgi:hypothetical protein